MKRTAIIPIRDRGQGWQWKSVDILMAGSSSFGCVLTSQPLECGWSRLKGPPASAARGLVSSGVTRAGLSVLHGWGLLSLEPDLEEILGDPELLSRCPHHRKSLPSWLVWWIRGMTPMLWTAAGVARTTVWGPVQTGWSGSFFQSLTHASSPADRDEPNCPKEWVSFLRFLRQFGGRLFPGPGGVRTAPGQLVGGGLPWAFLSLGVVSCIRSQRENSILGCIYWGRWESTEW